MVAGRTSCLRCADLARTDADPHWPAVLRQLSRVRISTPAALHSWAASTAAAQVLAFLHGELPESLARRWRSAGRPSSPDCGAGQPIPIAAAVG